ncbi:MAG: hypothetical protein GYB51_04165 [Rhodobacteraceae bacterium]|nr:hypothetical protein [Paracoccaceae bacterium]
MPEIDEITPEFDSDDMGSEDLLVIFSASADAGGRVPVSEFIAGNSIAVNGGNHDFGTSTITDLTSNTAIIANLVFASNKKITNMLTGDVSVEFAATASDASQTVAVTFTGAAVSMLLIADFIEALPDGLVLQGAWISGANAVSFKVYNATGSEIAGATYSARVAAFSTGTHVP